MSKDLEKTVYEILEKILEYHATPPQLEAVRNREDLEFEYLSLTSLHTAEVFMELEDVLGIELDTDEFDDIKKISDLVTLVKSRV